MRDTDLTPEPVLRLMDDLEGSAVTLYQAIRLMEVTDPELFAISANAHGITLYPRYEHQDLTTWEKTLTQACYPIPSDWTGYLQLTNQPMHEKWTTYLNMHSMSPSLPPPRAKQSKEQAVAFSLSRLLAVMQEYLSGGHRLEVKSMTELLQSICKVTSLSSLT